ncbi:MAG TPA: HNH endonuclease [Terriglobia bacterium]|nr:HNH endonuclease [Terriglobia bacterium]
MEGYLKRELAPDEIVHHINGDRSDDRLENLEVLSKSDHTRLHTLEAWSRGPQGPAKLTAEQVRLIRASDETTGAVLVRRFGVSEAAISMIRHEKTWKNVA